MRRRWFKGTELKIYESQLQADGFFTPPAKRKVVKPVSKRAKAIASVLCLVAFAGPLLFLQFSDSMPQADPSSCARVAKRLLTMVEAWIPPLCGAVAVALFWQSLAFDYTFDDWLHVANNDDVDVAKTSWSSVLWNDCWGRSMRSMNSHRSWRPLAIATYRAQTWWSGGPLAPRAARLPSVALHGVNAALAARLCAGAADRFGREDRFAAALGAAAGGLLFAAHPVHAEAVANVAQRSQVLARAEIKSSTRLRCARIRMFRRELFGRASRTR